MPTSSKTTRPYKVVAITTGDPKGIGYEVTAKALCHPEFLKHYQSCKKTALVVFKSTKSEQKKYDSLLKQNWLVSTFSNIHQCLSFLDIFRFNNKERYLFVINSDETAADWVVQTTKLCLNNQITSLVTGPLSKTLIKKSGYSAVGHTGLFKKLIPKADLYMGFTGPCFNVLLATDHIPFSSVEKNLTKKKIISATKASLAFKNLLKSKKPAAVLGLNPHAGESSMIGFFEKKNSFKGHVGPLIPDAAFFPVNWKKYSHYLCLYHDQGLIPFKMVHGQDAGVHITVGLPFIRTSVDHGTAFDIYNKDKANCSSMKDAIILNLNLIKGR